MRAFLVIWLSVAALAAAASPREAFNAGRYGESASQLEAELAQNPSAEGYVNAALACEKAGKPAEAILNYERALLLDPGLAVARNQLAELAAKRDVTLPPHRWTNDVLAVAHPDTMAALGSTLGWAGAFALLFAIVGERRRPWLTALGTLSLVFGITLFTLGWMSDPRLSKASLAVVTAEQGADVLAEPATNSDKIAELKAGSPVGILSPRGAWTYVDLAAGAKGWVQTDRLTPVVPGETL